MSDARSAIFAALRRSLRRGPLDAAAHAELAAGLTARRRPVRLSRHDANDPVDQFVTMATAAAAIVHRLPDAAAVPAKAAEILTASGLPPALKIAPSLRALPWDAATESAGIAVAFGRGEAQDRAAVGRALAGAAETGTLIAASGPEDPMTLNFLPDLHLVVIAAADVAPSYEDAFDRLRDRGAWPRTVNLITGPSRTGDLEQVIMLGAHGPRQLHILMLGE